MQGRLELVTRKWWFLLVFILLGTASPPITTRPYDPARTGEVIGHLPRYSLLAKGHFERLYPIFKVAPIVLILGLVFLGNRVRRIFSIYLGVAYVIFAIVQSVAITDKYGFGVVTGNFVLMAVVALFWFWEAFGNRNDFTPRKIPRIRYWVVPLAAIAFWYPLDIRTMKPDFAPAYIVTNLAGLAFCTMTPVYLALLSLYYPTVNIAALRVTALARMIIGFWNIIVNFIFKPDLLWWNGVLHLPLVAISTYAFILCFRRLKVPGAN